MNDLLSEKKAQLMEMQKMQTAVVNALRDMTKDPMKTQTEFLLKILNDNKDTEYGRKYKPCDGFPPGYRGTVYITAKGDYYYPSLDYPSLTRSVRIESLDDTCGRPKCSRCAERDHAA